MLLRDVAERAALPVSLDERRRSPGSAQARTHTHGELAATLLEALDWGNPLVRDVVRTHHASSAEASSADAPAAAAPRGLPFVKRLFGPRDDADWRARLTEIACVADRFTALTAHDPERPARTHRQIMLELTRQARSQLSHEVVVALLLNWAPADAIAGSQQSRSAERYAA